MQCAAKQIRQSRGFGGQHFLDHHVPFVEYVSFTIYTPFVFDPYPVSCTQNNALFMRLDSFLERCHDILDLTQTIVQFSKLAKIEVGGTKGNTLTASVKQVFTVVA